MMASVRSHFGVFETPSPPFLITTGYNVRTLTRTAASQRDLYGGQGLALPNDQP
jgi:hypothetical protein